MPPQASFQHVFDRLKRILDGVQEVGIVTADDPANFSLNTPYSPLYKKELFLGAVQIKKNYVSYYLMPVYMYPDLLEGISPALKKHMQGKSCFNFTAVDDALFKELQALTARSIQRLRSEGVVQTGYPVPLQNDPPNSSA
jgi:hypothetical protein